MNEANFIGVFIGIESPDTDALTAMRKKQNTRRNVAQSIHRIYAAGLYVTASFIVGFDSEQGSVADALIELIEEAAIPICMVGLLFALPNTQLTRRLASEGRLHAELLSVPDHAAAKARSPGGLQARPGARLQSYCLCRAPSALDASARRLQPEPSGAWRRFQEQTWGLEIVYRILSNLPGAEDIFRQTAVQTSRAGAEFRRTGFRSERTESQTQGYAGIDVLAADLLRARLDFGLKLAPKLGNQFCIASCYRFL